MDEDEDAEHVYWRCPAWAEIRESHLGMASVPVEHLPPITRTCGLLTEPACAPHMPCSLPPPEPFPEPAPWQPEWEDDTFSWGRRVAYTDGSAKGATFARRWRRAGYGVAWGKHHAQNVAAPLRGAWQSSQRAELTAALHISNPLIRV